MFTANGLSLYPFSLGEVHSKCSCPDPKNPCKHIAAVYYQLGDLFREDPCVLFQLRGRSRESLLEALRQKRQVVPPTETAAAAETTEAASSPSLPVATVDLSQFWRYDEPLDADLVVIAPSETTILDTLGKLPLPPEDAPTVMAHLKALYQGSAQQAMIRALG